jgi:hypothetical protein
MSSAGERQAQQIDAGYPRTDARSVAATVDMQRALGPRVLRRPSNHFSVEAQGLRRSRSRLRWVLVSC